MLGVSAGVPELEGPSLGNADQPSHVRAVVEWFGPTDFLRMDEELAAFGFAPPEGQRHSEASSPESILLGAKITDIPERVKAANPETYVRPGAPPFLIQHGTHDAIVPVQQSIRFASLLRQVLGEEMATLDLLRGAGHGDPAFETPENVRRVLDFLDSHLAWNQEPHP
jgi:dipeptidyl aminopeptidase/acylaminoacyl peptidase